MVVVDTAVCVDHIVHNLWPQSAGLITIVYTAAWPAYAARPVIARGTAPGDESEPRAP